MSEEQIRSSLVSHLQDLLVDVVSNTHLLSGDQISQKKMQKPRFVLILVSGTIYRLAEKTG